MEEDNMNYYTVQGSCLLSILIPLGLLVEEYAIWLKVNGWKKYKWKVDVFSCIIGVITIYYLINRKVDPYLPFITGTGIVTPIIQGNFIIKRWEVQKEQYNNLEIILKYIGIMIGIGTIILPHTNIFYQNVLSRCVKEVVVMCYVIYALFGMEQVIFRMIDIYRNKSKI